MTTHARPSFYGERASTHAIQLMVCGEVASQTCMHSQTEENYPQTIYEKKNQSNLELVVAVVTLDFHHRHVG